MLKRTIDSLKFRWNKINQSREEKRHSLVGAPHLWKMKQDFQFNFLVNHGMEPDQILLDVGCGTLRGGIPIIDFLDKGNYYGIEVRPEVLEEGEKELNYHKLDHKTPNLISFEKFESLQIDEKFDIIFAFSTLIHFEDHITKAFFEFLSRQLSEKGVFWGNVNIESYSDGRWQGFPIVFRPFSFYQKLADENNLLLNDLGKLTDLGHVSDESISDKQVMLEIRKK